MQKLFHGRISLLYVLLAALLGSGTGLGQDRLPKVVLVGDSIRMGYAETVTKELDGKAVIVSSKSNGGDSSNVLRNLNAWVIQEQPDVVHFNCGIHDTKKFLASGKFQVSPEQYEQNLRTIVNSLRNNTSALVLFATTTPIRDELAAKTRGDRDYELLEASIEQYNAIARKVMAELHVPVDDLHSWVMQPVPPQTTSTLMAGDGVHYTNEGKVALGKIVAAFVTRHLPKPDDLALQPPEINTQPGPEYSDEQRNYAMTIGIERTPKGRLWAAWVAGGDSDLGYFVAATSDDDGTTWSKPRLVIDPTDAPNGFPRRALVGNLWTDPTGRLWLFFDQSMGYFDGRGGAWAITCDNPDADHPMWSAPRRIWHGMTLNKPTVLSDGTWLMPISLWQRSRIHPLTERHYPTASPLAIPDRFKQQFPELDEQRKAHWFASNDNGKTWSHRGGTIFPKFDFDEHMCVELKDGRLWMLARTLDGIGESFSSDKGKTWTEPAVRFPHINARFFLRKLASGNLLLVKHGQMDERTKGRSHLMAFLSDDDGQTWKGGLLLDERSGISYPDGFQAPDGRIFISYDHQRFREREIALATFTEADVLAGQTASEGSRLKHLISKATGPETPKTEPVDPYAEQIAADAAQDRTSIPYDGITPNKMVCDTTLRRFPDGSWGLFLLAGDDIEPSPKNYIGLTRSFDEGKTWTPLEPVDTKFPREGKTSGQGATEILVRDNRLTMLFSTHSETWGRDWKTWFMHSDDNAKTWSRPEPAPGRLANFTFLRNHITTKDGRLLVPFQHYLGPGPDVPPPPAEERPWHKALRHYVSNPRNGILMSHDGGQTWTEHGNIRITDDDRYHGWAENNIVELSDGRIAMIIRADRLGGVLYYAESLDGGRTWPEFAVKTDIPNPGSKATLYPLGGDAVAMLHNPNPNHRSPMALWVSFDGMQTWPYRRVLVPESCDGPKGRLNYPDGFVSDDKQWLHFAFDDNRHRAVHYSAKLPPIP